MELRFRKAEPGPKSYFQPLFHNLLHEICNHVFAVMHVKIRGSKKCFIYTTILDLMV